MAESGAAGESPSNGGKSAQAGSATTAGKSAGGGEQGGSLADGGVGGSLAGAAPAGTAGAAAGADGNEAGGQGAVGSTCVDEDRDSYGVGDGCRGPDCDDADPLVNPSMLELADDGKDNDCQGGDLKAKDGPGYYVNGSDPSCSDAADAPGSKAAPYCSLAIAVVRSYQATDAGDPVGRNLFVAQGTYPFTTGTPKSMRIYGGYDASDWSYDSAANVTTLGGADVMQDPDGFKGLSSWISINAKANAVLQGFHIQGGKKPGAPIFAVEINSSGKVELYDNVIVAGEGYQTLAVNIVGETKNDPSSSDVWLLENRISAGTPTSSSNYGVNNLGTAVLWGNVIDMGQGSGTAQAFGAAVQNYGTMLLIDNVLNGGDYGGAVDASYGFINSVAGSLPNPGVADAYNNVLFGGRGRVSSVGVRNDAELVLVNNVIGDRTPGPLPFSQRPTSLATTVTSGFAADTRLQNNDLYNLIYSDEVSPPNASANRHLLEYSDSSAHPVDDLAVVNACAWTGCSASSGQNLALSPGFVGAGDFHLGPGSALIAKGLTAPPLPAKGLADVDIDGQLRPAAGWDIGIDQH